MRQQTFFLSKKSSYKNIFLCGTILAPNFMRANLLLSDINICQNYVPFKSQNVIADGTEQYMYGCWHEGHLSEKRKGPSAYVKTDAPNRNIKSIFLQVVKLKVLGVFSHP